MLTEKKAGPSLNNKIEVETFVVAKKANLDECSRQSVNEQLNIFFFEGTNVSFAESSLLTDFSAYFPPFIVVCLILCKLSFILFLNFFFVIDNLIIQGNTHAKVRFG